MILHRKGQIMSFNHILGIIAEYNPFHNGHLYHIQEAIRQSSASAIIIALSSHFVQRGEPSFIDKWSRTEAALKAGVDLVIEIPSAFSCQNAGIFASSGVDILWKTGIVTHISFGMENPKTELKKLATLLVEEPAIFKETLQRKLKEGFSFVESMAFAFEKTLPGSYNIIRNPNNILALNYMKRILEKKYPLTIVPIQRIGNPYHSKEISFFASATAIRDSIHKGDSHILKLLPQFSSDIIAREIEKGRCFNSYEYYWRILRATILRTPPEELLQFSDISEGAENLIYESAKKAKTFREMLNLCTSKRYPRSRIQRQLLHVLLGFKRKIYKQTQKEGIPYLRVLGMNKKGRLLLRKMRNTAKLPIVFRPRYFEDDYSRLIANFEFSASELWETLIPNQGNLKEKNTPPVRILE